MNRTKKIPTKPGAYWATTASNPIPKLLEVYAEPNGCLYIRGRADLGQVKEVSRTAGMKWSGPLVSVEEVEKAWMEGEAAGWTNANSIPERQVKFEDSRAHKIVQGEQV